MPTPEKVKLVEELGSKLQENSHLIFTDYRGLTVAEMTDLRAKLREHGVVYQVIKNNLVKIAMKGASIEGVDDYLFGPSAIAFIKDDPVSPSKVMTDFAKTAPKLVIKGGYSEGKVLNKEEIETIAKLPSREILLGKLVGCIQGPAYGLVSVLNGPMRSLVSILQQISEKKEN